MSAVIVLEPGSHARLSASGAERWLNCAGSPRLCDGLPDISRKEAEEGTVAHHVAFTSLETGTTLETFIGKKFKSGDHVIAVDQAMVDALYVYWHYIKDRIRDGEFRGTVWRKLEMDLTPELRKLHPDFGGMADSVLMFIDADGMIEVIDLKFGKGIWVSVVDNKQLRYYALGVLLTIEALKRSFIIGKIRITIIQPRCGDEPIRSEDFDPFELVDYAGDLINGAKATEDPNAPLNPGSWCHFCKANQHAKCPEVEKRAQELAKLEFEDLDAMLDALTPEKLGTLMDGIDAIEDRCKAVREHAYKMTAKGTPPIGAEGPYKFIPKRASRKWKDEQKVGDLLPDKEYWTTPQLKSPPQVEKLLGKAKFKENFAEYVEKVSSGYNLVRASDPTPAAVLVSPEDFEKLEGE